MLRGVRGLSSVSCRRWYVWGQNKHGELGLGDKNNRLVPQVFEEALDAKDLDLGDSHGGLVSAEHQLFLWGKGDYGQLGSPSSGDQTEPRLSETSTRITSIRCGHVHSVALDGKVFSWTRVMLLRTRECLHMWMGR